MKFQRISKLISCFLVGGFEVIKNLNPSSRLAAGLTTEGARDLQPNCTSTTAGPRAPVIDRTKEPCEKAETLLRAAARLALEEDEKVVLHVTIRGTGAWIIEANGGMKEALATGSSQARVHLTYASADVFLGLAHRSIDPRAALITGRLSFRGERGLGIRLGMCIRKALELQVLEKPEVEKGKLGIGLRNKWQRDKDSPAWPIFHQSSEERCGAAFQHRRPFFSFLQKPGDELPADPRRLCGGSVKQP